MYIHHTLSFMNIKEQYIVNNKHVELQQLLSAWLTYVIYWQTWAYTDTAH